MTKDVTNEISKGQFTENCYCAIPNISIGLVEGKQSRFNQVALSSGQQTLCYRSDPTMKIRPLCEQTSYSAEKPTIFISNLPPTPKVCASAPTGSAPRFPGCQGWLLCTLGEIGNKVNKAPPMKQ